MIRIIIADDHAIVRTGLRQIIERAHDMLVVAEAENGPELLEKIRRLPCDIVLQDMSMPGLSGANLVKRIIDTKPKLPVLVLSMHNEGPIATLALRAGASGYITKDSDPEMLISAVRKIIKGGKFIDPSLVDKILFDVNLNQNRAPHASLSGRELQIFQMLTTGLSVKEISESLSLSIKTVSTYKARIMEKLDADNIVALVRYAAQHGLIDRSLFGGMSAD